MTSRVLIAIASWIVLYSVCHLPVSFAQSSNCPSCVDILPEDIDLYQELFPLVVWTDSKVYGHNSVVKITGHLRPENNVSPILLTVTNPVGNIVTVDQISPDETGYFSIKLNTQSNLWKQDGDYIIKVQSGSDNRQFKTKFALISSSVGSMHKCTNTEIPVYADNGGSYCIPFQSSNGSALSVNGLLKLDNKTLVLQIRGQDIDSLIIDIPRYLIDSKSPSGIDSDFVVMSNGQSIEFQQLKSDDDSRQIKIDYLPTQSESYEIVGTNVIPEFGNVSLAIFLVSFVPLFLVGRLFSTRFVKF